MKKTLGLLVACATVLFSSFGLPSAFADNGKIVIYYYRWPTPPRPPRPRIVYVQPVIQVQRQPPVWQVPNYGQGSQLQQQQQQLIAQVTGNQSNITINNNSNNSGMVPLPPPARGGAVAYGDDTFLEGNQQAVIAWNGKTDGSGEQTLILTTNEKSATGQPMAMLSVLPLPGAPINIERANAKVFVQSKILFDEKLKKKGVVGGVAGEYGVIMTQKIGAHNIFVWEMEDISTFEDDIQSYIAQQYDNQAMALITPKTLEVIKGYHDRGFRYFAFDLTLVDDKTISTKEAISYRFKSDHAYYPLAISAIGGTGETLVDLMIATPGPVNLTGVVKDQDVILVGKTSVDFTMDEMKELDPSLAAVFEGSNLSTVKMRNILIEGKIDQFNGDFMASPAQ